jgi:ADP-ribose pyrophosphatase
MKNWKMYSKELVTNAKVFKYFKYLRESRESTKRGEFDVLECPNWVNIIPITTNGEIILVEQYRHGTDEITFEIPGGVMNRDERPLESAKRELREETGYFSDNWIDLGKVDVNPAFMTNSCHVFLAKDCVLKNEQDLDPLEEINVHLFSENKLEKMIIEQKIKHSLVVAGFCLYEYWKRKNRHTVSH